MTEQYKLGDWGKTLGSYDYEIVKIHSDVRRLEVNFTRLNSSRDVIYLTYQGTYPDLVGKATDYDLLPPIGNKFDEVK